MDPGIEDATTDAASSSTLTASSVGTSITATTAGGGTGPGRARRIARQQAAPILAVLGVLVALAAQFGITVGSPAPHPAWGFVPAVVLFAAAAFALAHPASQAQATPTAPSRAAPPALSLRWELVLLAGVVGVALFFRFFRFSHFPPGLWYDEGVIGADALSIIDKDHLTVWRDSNFGRASLYPYLLVLSFKTFGYTVFAFRIVPALAGIATVVAFYFLARWLLGPVPALVATALLAVSRFATTFSRISWDASLVPLFSVLAVYFFVRGMETGRKLFFALAGGSLAAGIYSYPSFRVVPIVMALMLAYVLVTERRLVLRNIPGIVVYGVAFLIVIAPLGQFAYLHQDKFLARTRDVSVFREIDRKDTYEPLRSNIRAAAEMMNVRGDGNGRHNLPKAPMLDEITGALFVLGLAVAVWSLRNWRRGSMAVWFVLSLVPGVLTISIENPSAIRTVGAIPPGYLLVGLAVAFLYRTLTPTRAGAALFAVGAVALVGSSAAINFQQLFGRQAESQAVYDAFIPVFTDVGQLAARQAAQDDVYVTAEFAAQPAFRVLARGKATRVYTPTTQIVLPRSRRDAFLIIDQRDFGIIPTLARLYPGLQRRDDVDPYGRTYFTSITIPASDLDAARALPFALYGSSDIAAAPQSTSRALPARAWSAGDLRAGGVATGVWDGYLWVPSFPGDTRITLASPGPVAIEIDGRRVIEGSGRVVSPPQALTFGEHRVRLIAGAATAGAMSAQVDIDGVVTDAADSLYATSAGTRGFQALFRSSSDFSTPPVQIARVPYAVGALPAGTASAEYRGTYTAPAAGTYGFALDGGSSAQLFVDDALVVDNGGGHSPRRVEGGVELARGPHVVSIQYANASPAPWALYLQPPGGPWRLADGSEFEPAAAYVQPALVSLAPDPTWAGGGLLVDGADGAAGIAVLTDGTIVTGARDTLFLIPRAGGVRKLKTPASRIADIDTTADGRIVVLDAGSRSLFVLSTAGEVLRRFDGAFASASGVSVAGDSAYVTSPSGGTVYRVPLAGGGVETLPISTAGIDVKAVQPSDIAIAADGTLYMDDFEKRQLVISADGATSRKTAGAGGAGVQVPHLAISGKLLLVTDPLNQRVLVYDRSGKQRGAYQFRGGVTGVHPTGIAVGRDGAVYVVDPTSARVYRLTVSIPAAASDLQP
ncbi:MAG: glycosyltransferase family 39 protein [Dehalococcoidia bacterium]|nr:glycosyltransferase family 39 protein [Dehalococcoidia bacterium]